jgi:hypothetical protein
MRSKNYTRIGKKEINVRGSEAVLNVVEEREGDPAAKGLISHAQERQAILHDIMENVP